MKDNNTKRTLIIRGPFCIIGKFAQIKINIKITLDLL